MRKQDLYSQVPCPDNKPGCLVYHSKLDQDKIADAIIKLFERIQKLENPIHDDLKNAVINIDKETVKLSDTFGFETALKYLKEGKKVSRRSYENQKNYARDKYGFQSLKINFIYFNHNEDGFNANILYLGSIKDNYDYNAPHHMYLLSTGDVLATDWYLVEEEDLINVKSKEEEENKSWKKLL